MIALTLTLKPQTAFGTPPHGDTLFGQLCWAIRNRYGVERLNRLLEGYTEGRPFVVVSDLLPAGYWPRPLLPGEYSRSATEHQGGEITTEGKAEKKKVWLPRTEPQQPVRDWLKSGKTNAEVWEIQSHPQPHNSIDRRTGTTGKGDFAPYELDQIWFKPGISLECHLVLDETRLTGEELKNSLVDIGATGFGRDASIGLGKFEVTALRPDPLPRPANGNAWLTLGFCAPQGLGFDPERSFYAVFTRFGRHGDQQAVAGNAFKTPLLLIRAGAVLTPKSWDKEQLFVGQGLGGQGTLSKTMLETVHQGYAPVVGIYLE